MPKQRKKRSTVSFKDIQIAYLMDGIGSIAKLHQEGKVSGITIRRALSNLKETGREVTTLEKWIRENFGNGIRGRTAPTPGQERIYRAQQIKTSGPFLRLPLAALQIDKGQVVSVLFQKDQIVVKKSMIIGCPSEIKVKEHRVGLVPAAVKALINDGHSVLIQSGAGIGSGISDEAYKMVGAELVNNAADIWQRAEIICKVKEPLEAEYPLMRAGQILYTYLHLAADMSLTKALLHQKVSAVAYETIQEGRTLPLLKPMSEVAGRMSIQVGAWCLEKHQGGKGLLLGGVTGVPKAKVCILGGGVVGLQAAKVALGMGAQVTILDTNTDRLEYLDHIFSERIQTHYSTPYSISECVAQSDLVVGAVLIAGAKAPKLITRELLSKMEPGSVIVDVAVDQGGSVETIRPTTHENPTFVIDGVIHYGVANMPGAVARTSTFALAQATLPYLRLLAGRGLNKACAENPSLALGLNTHQGYLTYAAVARAHGLEFHEYSQVLAAS